MPENRQRPERSAPREQPVLILSRDAVAAALLGGLVETLGYDVRFASPPESAEESVRRVKPRICLIDCTDPLSCRSEFLGRAAMRGVSVVIYGTREALDRVREVAKAHDLEMLLMPPELDALEAALQRAGSD
jgi:DNA-binding NtrC family response regulator